AIEAPARDGGGGIYGYDQKYLAWGGEVSAGRELPAQIDPGTEERIRDLARTVTAVTGIRGIARIGFLGHDGQVWVAARNTTPAAMAAYLWRGPPRTRAWPFTALVAEAQSTPARVFSTAGSDGTALRSAGTSASKLGCPGSGSSEVDARAGEG